MIASASRSRSTPCSIEPDSFTPQWGVFMGLRLGAQRLRRARSDEALVDVADWLWNMALQIEDGNLSDSEQQLRAAQDRLKEAMDRGAPNEEIRRLTDELRQAMDRFLREFAQRMRDNPTAQDPNGREPDRVISQNDLNRMLEKMEDAMRRGDMAEAERLSNELRNILENLQTARPNGRMTDPLGREMQQSMRDLEDMAREQQNLRDDTFRDGQNRRMQQGDRGRQQQRQGQRQRGQRGEQGDNQEQAENGEQRRPAGWPGSEASASRRCVSAFANFSAGCRVRACRTSRGSAMPRTPCARPKGRSGRDRTEKPSMRKGVLWKACAAACRAWPSRCSKCSKANRATGPAGRSSTRRRAAGQQRPIGTPARRAG